MSQGAMFHMKQYYNDDGRAVIVGAGAVDWITVTTFDADMFDAWESAIQGMYLGQPERIKRHTYTGVRYSKAVSLLSGYQNKTPHFMLQVSGSDADKVFRHLSDKLLFIGGEIKCTRIDVQFTGYPYIERKRLSDIAKIVQDDKEYNPRLKNCGLVWAIAGADGDTMYKGMRKSEKFMRIYDKKVSDEYDNEVLLERYEIEFKGATSDKIFYNLMHKPDRFRSTWIESVIKGQLEVLPNDALAEFNLWERLEANPVVTVTKPKIDRSISGGARWVRTISRALSRACREDGENGRVARETLFKCIIDGLSDDPLEDYARWGVIRDREGIDTLKYYRYTLNK